MPGTKVALFVQPGLSFKDLIANGGDSLSNLRRFVTPENHGVAIDRVRNPLSVFQEERDGVRLTRVPDANAIGDQIQKSDPHFVNVFEILLADKTKTGNSAEILKENDAVIGKVMKEMQRDNHPFVGIFTGEDVEGQAEEPEEFRPVVHVVKKREAEAPKKTDEFNANNLWAGDCIQAYFSSIEVKVWKDKDQVDVAKLETKPTVTSVCPDKKTNTITAVYKESQFTATITLSIKPYGVTRGWTLSGAEVTIENAKGTPTFTKALDVKPLDAWASKGFSFHCSAPSLLAPKGDDQKGNYATLLVKEMQVQGLMAKKDTKFGEAFDCVGFFSMPIFIGLLTSLLLIFFTTFAVVAMASIRTPEKFDDPRGQKISVPNE